MQLNKRAAIGMLSLGLVAGTAGAIGLTVHAQQNPSTQPQVQAQVQQPTAAVAQQPEVKTAADTDNIQDPAGQPEQPDAVTGQAEKPGAEAADSKTEALDNGAGHQDQGNVDHQFEGQE